MLLFGVVGEEGGGCRRCGRGALLGGGNGRSFGRWVGWLVGDGVVLRLFSNGGEMDYGDGGVMMGLAGPGTPTLYLPVRNTPLFGCRGR